MKTNVIIVIVLVIVSAVVSAYSLPLEYENLEGTCDTEEKNRDCSVDYDEPLARAYSYPQTQPTTINVPAEFPTIQDGINAAGYGDIVVVAAGVYTEHIILKSGVKVQGTGGSLLTPDNPSDDSVIDGAETGRPVTFAIGVSNASLAGFTITNGRGEYSGGNIACSGEGNIIRDNQVVNGATVSWGGHGGGIFLASSADHSKVINNIIQDNSAWASGGGIETRADGAVIEGNVIYNNQSDWAGGIYVSGSSTVIRKNIIDDNFADYRHGGGIYITSAANSTIIQNNTVVSNTAKNWGFGGAIYVEEIDEITIRNNIIANNLNSPGGTGGIHFLSCPVTLTLTYNDTYDNQGSDYFGCTPEEGSGSISADPLFVDIGNRNYHLQSGSPAIDAGDPDPTYYDLEDPANPGYALYPAMGAVRNDMGAYGDGSYRIYLPWVCNPYLWIRVPKAEKNNLCLNGHNQE